MGSLIALLVAAQVLGNNSALTAGYRRQVVLAALAGETWDYMGSRRLLWEMDGGQNSTEGLQLEQISQASPRCCMSNRLFQGHQCSGVIWNGNRSPRLLESCIAPTTQG